MSTEQKTILPIKKDKPSKADGSNKFVWKKNSIQKTNEAQPVSQSDKCLMDLVYSLLHPSSERTICKLLLNCTALDLTESAITIFKKEGSTLSLYAAEGLHNSLQRELQQITPSHPLHWINEWCQTEKQESEILDRLWERFPALSVAFEFIDEAALLKFSTSDSTFVIAAWYSHDNTSSKIMDVLMNQAVFYKTFLNVEKRNQVASEIAAQSQAFKVNPIDAIKKILLLPNENK